MEVLIKQGKLKNFIGQERKDERLPQKGKVEELVCPPLGEIRVIVREYQLPAHPDPRIPTFEWFHMFSLLVIHQEYQGWTNQP